MKTNTALFSALLFFLVGFPPLAAQQTNQPQPPVLGRFGNPTATARIYQGYLYGVIKKIDKQDLVLDKTYFGVPKTITINKGTKFIRNGKSATLAQLKLGEDVYVDVKKNKKTGEMLAKKVVTGVGVTN
ncbi:MAG TPA: hypothetical protein VMX16_04935 [Terriglobia bacterium]|nr:hypothetical protein [Terriglobia bacterium]